MPLTEQEQEKIILKQARIVRRWALRKGGGISMGMCADASQRLRDQLRNFGVYVKVVDGVFQVDLNGLGELSETDHEPSHDEAHYWCEWKHLPIDVTADQFNDKLLPINQVKPILFGTDLDRYLTWNFKPMYI